MGEAPEWAWPAGPYWDVPRRSQQGSHGGKESAGPVWTSRAALRLLLEPSIALRRASEGPAVQGAHYGFIQWPGQLLSSCPRYWTSGFLSSSPLFFLPAGVKPLFPVEFALHISQQDDPWGLDILRLSFSERPLRPCYECLVQGPSVSVRSSSPQLLSFLPL